MDFYKKSIENLSILFYIYFTVILRIIFVSLSAATLT